MAVSPANINLVKLQLTRTGCCKSGFDSTYPANLNEIIQPDEYQESIKKINRAISPRLPLLIIGLISILCVIGSIVLFIIGSGKVITTTNSSTFSPFLAIALGVLLAGPLFFLISFFVIQCLRPSRMRRAIAKESMKYSTRSSKPCIWHLNAFTHIGGRFRGRRSIVVIYSLMIDLVKSAVPMNQSVPYQPSQMAPNLPTGFCSHCGKPRQNLTTSLCSSCGQPFSMP